MTFPMLLTFTLAANPTSPTEHDFLRVATFNASLSREEAGGLLRDLSTTDHPQIRNIAEILQRVRPDIVLINEFDYAPDGQAVRLFQKNYLSVMQREFEPIEYPYFYVPEVNTGVASGVDLNNNGQVVNEPGSREYGGDAFGYGLFPGQYGMVLLSNRPIDPKNIQCFREFLWKEMPGALLPEEEDGSPWYSKEALAVFRLSSKNHCVVPIQVDGRTIHALISHPTPPAFDGPERRNQKRNHDEIRLWADYITGGDQATYLPLGSNKTPPESFVILGDLNCDPHDGDSIPGAIQQLLDHPRVNSKIVPASSGGPDAARQQGGANLKHQGPPEHDTADFSDAVVGNLRVDYVLPSKDFQVLGGAIFWPTRADPLARLVRMEPEVASSDHRLVYLDLRLAPARD
ncbi:endonuclease/exonuclease/phosphatase family protein [soil metagenome]